MVVQWVPPSKWWFWLTCEGGWVTQLGVFSNKNRSARGRVEPMEPNPGRPAWGGGGSARHSQSHPFGGRLRCGKDVPRPCLWGAFSRGASSPVLCQRPVGCLTPSCQALCCLSWFVLSPPRVNTSPALPPLRPPPPGNCHIGLLPSVRTSPGRWRY